MANILVLYLWSRDCQASVTTLDSLYELRIVRQSSDTLVKPICMDNAKHRAHILYNDRGISISHIPCFIVSDTTDKGTKITIIDDAADMADFIGKLQVAAKSEEYQVQ